MRRLRRRLARGPAILLSCVLLAIAGWYAASPDPRYASQMFCLWMAGTLAMAATGEGLRPARAAFAVGGLLLALAPLFWGRGNWIGPAESGLFYPTTAGNVELLSDSPGLTPGLAVYVPVHVVRPDGSVEDRVWDAPAAQCAAQRDRGERGDHPAIAIADPWRFAGRIFPAGVRRLPRAVIRRVFDIMLRMSETIQAPIGVVVSSRAAADAAAAVGVGASGVAVELSIVMPCLNEADTLGICVEKALQALRENQIAGEVVVADNGSTDGSQEIARKLGAKVVAVAAKGYGNALMGGIAAARGRFVLMGDADDSYDFLEAPKFLALLRQGRALVQGCRLPGGGGTIKPGAMPFLHRWWGNPMFSLMARRMFKAPIHDVYCGMRGFTKELYARLDLRCTGMEFATEMIIKASLYGDDIAEVPITLHPDGRKSHAPHLKTFRDGWRTLRFYLMYSPRWLFLIPGLALIFLAVVGYALALPAVTIRGVTFDAHTLLVSTLALLLGYQAIFFAVAAKVFATSEGLLPEDPKLNRFFAVATLERGILAGVCSLLGGLGLLVWAVVRWAHADWGPLDYASTMRIVIPAFALVAVGSQTILSSFFISILGMRRK